MEPAEALKLYLIGLLSLVGLVAAGLVYLSVVPVADRASQGTQYLLVGVLLGAVFGFLGGFDDLASRLPTRRTGIDVRRTLIEPRSAGSRMVLFGRFDLRAGAAGGPSVDERRATPEPATARAPAFVLPVPAGEVTVRPATVLEVSQAVARHETGLVDRLVRDGALTGDGPITDEDVRIMVVTSVISEELSERLLGFIDPTCADGPCRGPARLVDQTAAD